MTVTPALLDQDQKTLLHIGAGASRGLIPPQYKQYRELTLDICPDYKPDFQADMRDMKPVADQSVDAIYSAHNIEHVYSHEVIPTLKEFYRALKTGGTLYLRTPDLQGIGEYLAKGDAEAKIYTSASGPITAIDILYGHAGSTKQGHEYMAHKTGFTAKTLATKLFAAGFRHIEVTRWFTELHATAVRPAERLTSDQIKIHDKSKQVHREF